MAYYESGPVSGQQSGAYIFRPSSPEKIHLNLSNTEWRKGGLVSEQWRSATTEKGEVVGSFVVRTFGPDPDHIEVEWLVGPIPTDKDTGKEVELWLDQF